MIFPILSLFSESVHIYFPKVACGKFILDDECLLGGVVGLGGVGT